MFSNFILGLILIVFLVVVGYKYIAASYKQKNPGIQSEAVKSVFVILCIQIGVWLSTFFPMWMMLPSNQYSLLGTDLGNLLLIGNAPIGIVDGMYNDLIFQALWMVVFCSVVGYILYLFYSNSIIKFKESTIKTLTTIITVLSTGCIWGVVGFAFLLVLSKWAIQSNMSEDSAGIIFFTGTIALLVWLIIMAVKMQKAFNRNFPIFYGKSNGNYSNGLNNQSDIMPCPYCGEQILKVAKKCKHCGEWIKEEDVMAEVNETPISAPRNAFREKVAAERTITSNNKGGHNKSWLWWLIGIAVVATTCIIILSNKSDGDDEPFDPAWYQEPQESEPSESDFIID